MQIVGLLTVLSMAAFVGYDIYDVISSGEYEDWGLLDWLFNIGTTLLFLTPLIQGSAVASRDTLALLRRKLIYLPYLGSIFVVLNQVPNIMRITWTVFASRLFRKGGFLYVISRSSVIVLRYLKKPYVLFALLLASQYTQGIIQHLFHIIGTALMKLSLGLFGLIMGLIREQGDPIGDLLDVLDGSSALLPACFTAVLGALHVQDLIGMITACFTYLFAIRCINASYALYTRVEL